MGGSLLKNVKVTSKSLIFNSYSLNPEKYKVKEIENTALYLLLCWDILIIASLQ